MKKTTKKPATPAKPKRKRRSVRDPDHSMSWRQREEAKGRMFVQFWTTNAEVATRLNALVAARRAVEKLRDQKKIKPKTIIEDLILSAHL
jgi:hypothetical protein